MATQQNVPVGALSPRPEEWLRPQELAPLIKTTTQGLASMRHEGTGPTYYKPGGRVLYRWMDVLAWLEQSAYTATGHRAQVGA